MARTHPAEGCSQVGSYLIDELLGEGASAMVFAARHHRLGHAVAIKLLRPELARPLRARFVREARALAEIESRHVPQVHDMGELEDGTPYVVMERLLGESLAEALERDGPLPIERVVWVGTQLAAALSAVHAAGWIHRDVKPENLVLHRESDGRVTLKLCDFGVATRVRGSGDRLTLRGRLVGTPEYMSPEQARGLPVSEASDVFSAGAVLYELACGRAPFERPGATPHEIAMDVIQRPAVPLRERREDCPPWLDRVVGKALAKPVVERYASAAALARGLSSKGRHRALHLTEDVPIAPPRRRWAKVMATLTAATVVATLGFAFTEPELARSLDARVRAMLTPAPAAPEPAPPVGVVAARAPVADPPEVAALEDEPAGELGAVMAAEPAPVRVTEERPAASPALDRRALDDTVAVALHAEPRDEGERRARRRDAGGRAPASRASLPGLIEAGSNERPVDAGRLAERADAGDRDAIADDLAVPAIRTVFGDDASAPRPSRPLSVPPSPYVSARALP